MEYSINYQQHVSSSIISVSNPMLCRAKQERTGWNSSYKPFNKTHEVIKMKICAYFVSATVISAFSPFSNEKNLSDEKLETRTNEIVLKYCFCFLFVLRPNNLYVDKTTCKITCFLGSCCKLLHFKTRVVRSKTTNRAILRAKF